MVPQEVDPRVKETLDAMNAAGEEVNDFELGLTKAKRSAKTTEALQKQRCQVKSLGTKSG